MFLTIPRGIVLCKCSPYGLSPCRMFWKIATTQCSPFKLRVCTRKTSDVGVALGRHVDLRPGNSAVTRHFDLGPFVHREMGARWATMWILHAFWLDGFETKAHTVPRYEEPSTRCFSVHISTRRSMTASPRSPPAVPHAACISARVAFTVTMACRLFS